MPFPIWNTFLSMSVNSYTFFKTQPHCPLHYLNIPIHPQNSGSPLDSRNHKSLVHHSPDLTHPSSLGTPQESGLRLHEHKLAHDFMLGAKAECFLLGLAHRARQTRDKGVPLCPMAPTELS